jgi:Fructose-bisphosphate aldolase class-II
MFDGRALPLKENLDIAVKLIERFRKSDLILEIEAGVVGGEEDGIKASAAAKLYTTPEDTLEVARRLNAVKGAQTSPVCPPGSGLYGARRRSGTGRPRGGHVQRSI